MHNQWLLSKKEQIDSQWYSLDREIDYWHLDIEYLWHPKFRKKEKRK
jgi:hypothetical protein